MAKQEYGHIVETAIEARGAERGPTVRNVLVWSLGLVVGAAGHAAGLAGSSLTPRATITSAPSDRPLNFHAGGQAAASVGTYRRYLRACRPRLDML